MSPFIDGELAGKESSRLEEHLESCPDCDRRLKDTRAMVSYLSSLPVIEPTLEESYRLMNRVRAEMAEPGRMRPVHARLRVTAAAITILIAVSIGTTWAILAGGQAPTKVEVTSGGQDDSGWISGPVSDSDTPATTRPTQARLAMATMTQPSLSVSQKDYSPSDLKAFRNDLGTRLDFYSSYWYPASTGSLDAVGLTQKQGELTDVLAAQAGQAGKNPQEVKAAVKAALDHAGQEIPLLPCYAEQAKVEGKDAWLISVSGPEDYLLFSNKQLPSAMYLATQGGEPSLKISEALLQQLAGMLAPLYTGVADTAGSPQSLEEMPILEVETKGATTPEQQRQFQSFLSQVAAQYNSLDLISALEGLNYEQLLMLVQGNWSRLAVEGVDLTEFLAPPKRLFAVDTATGTVIWTSSK